MTWGLYLVLLYLTSLWGLIIELLQDLINCRYVKKNQQSIRLITMNLQTDILIQWNRNQYVPAQLILHYVTATTATTNDIALILSTSTFTTTPTIHHLQRYHCH